MQDIFLQILRSIFSNINKFDSQRKSGNSCGKFEGIEGRAGISIVTEGAVL